MPDQASHGVQFPCISLLSVTGSGTLYVRSPFLVPLSDASKSFFFFPMVMRRRAVVRDRSGGVRGVGDGNDDADRFFKAGRTGYDAIDDGAEA
jgi:hypothetical protein